MGTVVLLVLALLARLVAGEPLVIDVVANGAVGDGKTDDSKAFLRAWGAACVDPSSPTLLIPEFRTFLLSTITFSGPCKSSIHVQVLGNIVAPDRVWPMTGMATWITFININDLTIDGVGQIDGRGAQWWDCKSKGQCNIRPNAFGMLACKNLRLSGLKFINSPQVHVTVYGSVGVHISGITVSAPGDSPNTDGMHIQECQHVEIVDSTIQAGDDCIGLGGGSYDVNISHINCGPGHGISIGSLGMNGARDTVEMIHVSNCNFFETMTGLRIKTWQGAAGYVRGVLFDHITVTGVETPIDIDQFYCPAKNCQNKTTTMQLSDVRIMGVRGTATVNPAIKIACSNETPCTGVYLHDVIVKSAIPGGRPTSYCHNAQGSLKQPIYPPVPCLG